MLLTGRSGGCVVLVWGGGCPDNRKAEAWLQLDGYYGKGGDEDNVAVGGEGQDVEQHKQQHGATGAGEDGAAAGAGGRCAALPPEESQRDVRSTRAQCLAYWQKTVGRDDAF